MFFLFPNHDRDTFDKRSSGSRGSIMTAAVAHSSISGKLLAVGLGHPELVPAMAKVTPFYAHHFCQPWHGMGTTNRTKRGKDGYSVLPALARMRARRQRMIVILGETLNGKTTQLLDPLTELPQTLSRRLEDRALTQFSPVARVS